MPTVLIMAVKDLRLISRDWLGMFFIIAFPIAMGIFFGAIMRSMGEEGTASLSIGVVDEDRSSMSKRFVEDLRASGNVRIETLSRKAALDRVRRGQLAGMLAIPKGFGETAGLLWLKPPTIEVGVDPGRKAEAAMLQGMIMRSMGKLMVARFQDPASVRPLVEQARQNIESDDDVPLLMRPALLQMVMSFEKLIDAWEAADANNQRSRSDAEDAEVRGGPNFELARVEQIDVTRKAPKGSQQELIGRVRSAWDISFPQAMMWGVLASAAGFAITFVRERKQGTLLRLQVAPVTRAQLVAGKAAACFITVLAVIGVMIALGAWLGMRPRSPALLFAAAVCVAFCFVGVMMLMSVVGKTEEAVSGAAWGANIVMAMFGGGMVPLLFLPEFMRVLSNASPVKWSILALEGAIWRGFTWSEMLLPCGILLAVGAVCLALGTAATARITQGTSG